MNISQYHAKYFDVNHLMKDLKNRSIRGGSVTLSFQGIKFIIQMVSTLMLARLLTPKDHGLVAMVTAISGFLALFKDLGLSMATIQKKDINHQQVSTLFWINLGVSILLGLLLGLLAPIVSRYYHEPRLLQITLVLACSFIFSGLTVQHQALLRRQMRFLVLGIIEVVSMAAGVACGIVMAYMGSGYWALVGMTVFSAIINALLVWYYCGWRPGLPSYNAGIRSLLKFGGHLTGFSIVNYFSRNLDHILIGRYAGAQVLGFYSKAYNIMMLPISQIRFPLESVAIPALSHMQDDPERYRRYYLKLIELVAFLSMPLMVFMFVYAEEVILLLLGPNWSGSVNIFKVLCIVSFIQPVSSTRGLVLISLGQSQKYLRWGIANAIITVLSFVAGLPWSAIGVAIAYVISNYIFLIPSLWYCFKNSPITIKGFCFSIAYPVVTSIVMGLLLSIIRSYIIKESTVISVSLMLIIGLVLYLMMWLMIPYGRTYLKELSSYRNYLLNRK